MRRFNFMLNGSRLMMFPSMSAFWSAALLMVKFAMLLYALCIDIVGIHYMDLITGVLTLVDFVLVAQMLILVSICGYVQFIQTQQREALGNNWLSKINFASLKSSSSTPGHHRRIEVLKAFLDDGVGNEVEMKWSVIVFSPSTAALIYAVTERLADHK
ncbi:YqhA family protein [Aeromonas hydrophila]|uniref:YqhA family protein n=1 Tax=Aeromonas hydrophila TaxID=644 RepID=A0A926FHR1_AERHY|nr:YqhA family protein [Aeromonas hydrophila]